MNGDEPGKGLHIDDDWKTEAAQEKKRLAAQERAAAKGGGGTVPEAGFMDLLNLIAVQAAVGLGGMQGPGGEHIPPNPLLAKHHIDLLGVLAEKTAGNLTPEEKKTLDAIIYELRMQYVQMAAAGGMPPAPDAPAETPGT